MTTTFAEIAVADLQRVHRGDLVARAGHEPGHVLICSSVGGFRTVAAISADWLAGMLPGLASEIERDSYYSVNAFAPDERGRVRRLASRVRWLTSLFVDLDHHRQGLDHADVVARVIRAADTGMLPRPSIVSDSGRGTWLFWLLRSADGDYPAEATAETVALYQRLQVAVADVVPHALGEVGLDRGAMDRARVTRIPGSVNVKSGRRVRYGFLNFDADTGRPLLYRMSEIADELGLPAVAAPRTVADFVPAVAVSTGLPPRRVNGSMARYARILGEIDLLRAARGRFGEGTRRRALWLWCYFTRRLRRAEWDEIEAELVALARDGCEPTGDWDAVAEASGVVRDVRRFGGRGVGRGGQLAPPSNRTVADWLAVTPAEADHLGLRFCRPDFAPRLRGRRGDLRVARRAAIAEIVADCESTATAWTIDHLVAQLHSRGLPGSLQSVHADLRDLGLASPAQRRRRERRDARARQLPLG